MAKLKKQMWFKLETLMQKQMNCFSSFSFMLKFYRKIAVPICWSKNPAPSKTYAPHRKTHHQSKGKAGNRCVGFHLPVARVSRRVPGAQVFERSSLVLFLPILLVFFPVFAIGLNNAKDGIWPPISVWLGNLVLLLCGAYWLKRVYRS